MPQVCMEIVDHGGGVFQPIVDNNTFEVVFFEIDLVKDKTVNIKASQQTPFKEKINSQATGQKLGITFQPADPTKDSSFETKFSVFLGDPSAKSDGKLFTLPYKKGDEHELAQGFNGAGITDKSKQTHNNSENFHSVDFAMPQGTAVHAARGGIIAEVKSDAEDNGTSNTPANQANIIRILHDDGTYASYVHLKKNSAKVKPGDKVKTGDQIAESGNSGRTSGPHLHFSVSVADGKGKFNTVSWQFEDPAKPGNALVLSPPQKIKH